MELMSPPDSSTGTPLWTKALLRELLLGNDICNVRFHVFSRRSKSRALDPRVLNANITLLKSSSKYFADLSPAPEPHLTTGSDGDNKHSDACVSTTENGCNPFQQNISDAIRSSSEGTVSLQPNGMLWALGGGRHIFVKDAAFQTWYCLLHFLYMGIVEFSPLRSSGPQGSKMFSRSTSQTPKCSAKSMYRLATKLGIGELRDQAFASIRSNIDENNLLQELASRFTGRYPAVLEMELDLLLKNIASAPIVEGLPRLMERISEKELSHGAKIMAGFYTRILQKHYSTCLPTRNDSSRSDSTWPQSPPPSFGIPQVAPVSVSSIVSYTKNSKASQLRGTNRKQ
ncbi:hypothetical protein PISMIDRAFT_689880 [Pisolithus microcarpus 441]|uniref:BTB domain-containing protein n=1 Tax=Pisolithus microcarpus 441 TaxID=765257 RepID=A0A0C9YVY8_9AGAM|nr:hypothetical protein PISMIDRAFT_689880 [Pisolithus microcarpus 441]